METIITTQYPKRLGTKGFTELLYTIHSKWLYEKKNDTTDEAVEEKQNKNCYSSGNKISPCKM